MDKLNFPFPKRNVRGYPSLISVSNLSAGVQASAVRALAPCRRSPLPSDTTPHCARICMQRRATSGGRCGACARPGALWPGRRRGTSLESSGIQSSESRGTIGK
eukprot:gene8485-biopygen16631